MTQKRKTAVKAPRDVEHIKDLVPDPANRRRHNPRNIGMVVDALQSVGAARSIVIDEHGVILAGNGVTEAAAEAGITKVRVIEADGNEIIAVRRRGLTEDQKRQLAIYDNRTAELAEWDFEQLAADKAAGLSLQPFWTAEEEAKLGAKAAKGGLTDPDDCPEQRHTSIVAGDLFELGAHRLLCGDSTAQGDVARLLGNVVPFLMVTDPPYGIDYDPEWRSDPAVAASIRHPKKGAVDLVKNDDRADWLQAWVLFPGTVGYVWHAGTKSDVVAASLFASGLELRSQIVWSKHRFVLSRCHYHPQHEPCWYVVRKGSSARWCGDRTQSTLWEIEPHQKSETGHSTQKPVECMERPIRNHGGNDDAVYEPFSGSGTTIIAAERQSRRCFAIELTPAYVQMAIDRWEAFTGKTAVKVGDAVAV